MSLHPSEWPTSLSLALHTFPYMLEEYIILSEKKTCKGREKCKTCQIFPADQAHCFTVLFFLSFWTLVWSENHDCSRHLIPIPSCHSSFDHILDSWSSWFLSDITLISVFYNSFLTLISFCHFCFFFLFLFSISQGHFCSSACLCLT